MTYQAHQIKNLKRKWKYGDSKRVEELYQERHNESISKSSITAILSRTFYNQKVLDIAFEIHPEAL
jgi:hypothetical protein